MIDQQSVERAAERFQLPEGSFERLELHRDRRQRNRRIRAGVLGIAIAILVGWWGIHAITSTAPRPAIPPDPPVGLGIFAPASGKIVYYSNSGLWAVDPNAASPVSTLTQLDTGGTADRFASFTVPLGWSSDGTELLFLREDPADDTFPYDRHLFILHSDGTETQVVPEPVASASISPDGSRVVYTPDSSNGVFVVDVEGGEPDRISAFGRDASFSPDGTQIAYLSSVLDGCCVESGRELVWVANANGTAAHEILTDEPALDKGVFELTWSPAGDRIAMGNSLNNHVAIYTFAPDGSDFTKVIDGGMNPFWSPDGSQIAFEGPGAGGASKTSVSIADSDGSDVQTFGFGRPGPWHPGRR